MRTYRFGARLRRRGRSAGGLPARPLRRAPERFARGASGGGQGHRLDYRLEESAVDPAKIPGIVAEMGSGKLGARWTRVVVHWTTLQPSAPGASSAGDTDGDGYADAYLARLDAAVEALHAEGIRIILTPSDVPEWASDRTPWQHPPSGCPPGYSPIYAMDVDDPAVLAQSEGLGAFRAGRYKGSADYVEC